MDDFEKGRIYQAHLFGWNNQQIAFHFNRGVSTIADFLKKMKETNDYHRKKGTGKKRKLSDSDVRYAQQLITRNRGIKRSEIVARLGKNIHVSTVTRAFQRSGFTASSVNTDEGH